MHSAYKLTGCSNEYVCELWPLVCDYMQANHALSTPYLQLLLAMSSAVDASTSSKVSHVGELVNNDQDS